MNEQKNVLLAFQTEKEIGLPHLPHTFCLASG
jgi:hypothetical protein